MIEFLVATIIMIMIVAMATPVLRTVVDRHRINTVVNRLRTDVAFARSAAVTRSSFVSLCASSDEESCGGTYSDSRIVYGYTAGRAVASTPIDHEGIVLRSTRARKGVSIKGSRSGVISFDGQGQLVSKTGAPPLVFKVCLLRGSDQVINTPQTPGKRLVVTP
ncbi:GspH/FimT family protein, partial [Dyella sp.]|uniref:GspH/FimT family pseudopilin n=1 Tax=Dyella sp. TaxID=1869338 RepID=UPI002ED0CF4D